MALQINMSKISSGTSAFPSILHTSGQNLIDAGGHVLPRLKGFNIQAAGWPQQTYDDIYTKGGRILRLMVFWDSLEPTAGSINTTFVAALDTSITRAEAAGLYVVLCFYYGPNGQHKPSWVVGTGPTDSRLRLYTDSNNGQLPTQYLANRYGNPASAHYTKAVIGMGINEPTPDSTSNSYLATHLVEQKQMMTWFRADAPNWIGFISAAYGPSAWLPNVPGSGHTSDQTFTGAPNDPFSGMGNWLVEAHCYFEATTDGNTRTWDGRNQYGMPNGAAIYKAGAYPYPPDGITRANCQASLAAFWAPYIAYCGSGHAHVPLCVGEWGWTPSFAGGDMYAADMDAAMSHAGAAIEMEWDYNTSTSSDPWAARPGGVWQTATGIWISSTTPVVTSLLPPTGKTWFGSSTSGSITLANVETSILNGTRKVNIVHAYRKLDSYDSVAFPGNGDDGVSLQTQSDGGRILFLNFAFKIAGAYPAGTSTWSNIASGVYDSHLITIADKIKSWYATYGRQLFVSWAAESDGSNGLGVQGTSYTQFVAAWQHIHNLFVSRGAMSACQFVFDMAGYKARVHEWNSMYPGDTYVDWLGYDPYGKVDPATGAPDATAHVSYGEDESDAGIDDTGLYRFYKWANGAGAKDTSDGSTYTKAGSHTMPIMICETGLSYNATADATYLSQYRTWWSDLTALLSAGRYPLIRAWVFFPSINSYDPRLDVGSGSVASPQAGSMLANFRSLAALSRLNA